MTAQNLSPEEKTNTEAASPLLQVRGLKKYFPIRKGLLARVVGQVRAVDGVSFEIPAGKTFSLVGESGCGKTTVGRTILRLLEPTAGQVIFDNREVFSLTRAELRPLRRNMQIIFQDPYSSLNPRMTVEDLIAEGLVIHGLFTPAARREKIHALLETVGLRPEYAARYPHQFSGGQRQRIGIARALALEPKFIVCDESISALDVSVQAQVINLLQDLQEQHNIAYLFIAHDLSVVRHISDRVGVMYLGQMMEVGDCDEIYNNPLHPYTKALLSAIPEVDPRKRGKRQILTGDVPRADNPPPGCPFHTRCPEVRAECKSGIIPISEPSPGHRVQCVLHTGRD